MRLAARCAISAAVEANTTSMHASVVDVRLTAVVVFENRQTWMGHYLSFYVLKQASWLAIESVWTMRCPWRAAPSLW